MLKIYYKSYCAPPLFIYVFYTDPLTTHSFGSGNVTHRVFNNNNKPLSKTSHKHPKTESFVAIVIRRKTHVKERESGKEGDPLEEAKQNSCCCCCCCYYQAVTWDAKATNLSTKCNRNTCRLLWLSRLHARRGNRNVFYAELPEAFKCSVNHW